MPAVYAAENETISLMTMRPLVPILVALAALLAACGDDGDGEPATPPAPEAASPVAPVTTAPAAVSAPPVVEPAPTPAAAVPAGPETTVVPPAVVPAEPAPAAPASPAPAAAPAAAAAVTRAPAPAPAPAVPTAEPAAPAPEVVAPVTPAPNAPVTPAPAGAAATTTPTIAPAPEAAPAAAAPIAAPTPITPVTPAPGPTPMPAPATPPATLAPLAPGAPPAAGPLDATELPVDLALRARVGAVNPGVITAFAAPCLICHVAAPGDVGRLGPNLYEVVGRAVAGDAGFVYSPALAALGAAGAVWTYERLDAFLADPQAAVPGTRMAFAGLANPDERAATIAWLRSLDTEPAPLAAGVRPADRVGLATTFADGQADAGATAYVREGCQTCHADNLRGVVDVRGDDNGGDGPPLMNANFELHFFHGSMAALFHYIQDRMPPTAPGTVPDETVVNLIAFILRANGFAPGDPLPADLAGLEAMGFWQ
jgi:cytochrome c2